MLTDQQKQHFIEHGYLHIPGGAGRDLALKVRRVVNASIGEEGIDPAMLTTYRAQSYCPQLRGDPSLTDLFNAGPVRAMIESLVGPGNIQPVRPPQVALRFPNLKAKRTRPSAHIDGIHTPTNGVPKGTLAHFTMLVGVLLSDLPDEWAGNFTVFPGSHRRVGDYFRGRDPKEMVDGMPKVDFGEPKQITGRVGDVVIAHYLTGHGVAPNASPEIRYACFFRVWHTRHELHAYRPEALQDIWLDWDGLHPLLGR